MIKKYKPLYKTKKQIPRRYTENLLPSEKKQMEKEILSRPKSLKFWTGDKLYKRRIDKEKVKIPKSQYYLKYVKKYGKENTGSLFKISKVTKIPLKILKEVYKRGIGAWTSGHRPGVMPTQWAMARVYSFVMKGKTTKYADKDLFDMIKRKRNPLKDDKKLMRKVAELLARAIEKEPDGITAYLLAAELVRRDSLYCEECQSFDIEKDCDWSICYPEIYELEEDSTLDSAKEAAEDLAEDLGIVDYVNVFIYGIQLRRHEDNKLNYEYEPKVDLSGVDLSGVDLSGVDLYKINLFQSNLTGANLTGANLRGADLFQSNLSEANLKEANLKIIKLTGANLTGANLTNAKLARADLQMTKLVNANLCEADLYRADLTGANLTGANLTRADLLETIFTNAKVTPTTNFKNVDIKEAIGLVISNPRKVPVNDKKKTKKPIKRR